MSKCKFEVGKTYKTRGGGEATILATDIDNARYPIVARVKDMSDNEEVLTYTAEGVFHIGVNSYANDLKPPTTKVRGEFAINSFRFYGKPNIEGEFSGDKLVSIRLLEDDECQGE